MSATTSTTVTTQDQLDAAIAAGAEDIIILSSAGAIPGTSIAGDIVLRRP